MKRESAFVIIVSTILNFAWSIVFDLLPNLIDYDRINISLIRPIYYGIFVLGFIVINLIVVLLIRMIMKKTWKRETRIKLIEEAINKQIINEVEELPNKPPQMLPGEYRPFFYHYSEAINQLNNENGWIEFELEGPPPDFDNEKPIFLCEVIPGMHQHFMVVIQNTDFDDGIPPYCRIKPDDLGTSKEFTEGSIQPEYLGTSQEFTEDWYNTLFAIFSSFSQYISPKREGPGMDMRTHYVISKYKFSRKDDKHYLRIRIV
jgi:hypothetical protein